MTDLFNVFVFAIFAALWIAFGVAIVAGQGSIDQVWEWLRGLPLVLQAIVAFLVLPVAIGLWVWETTWPLIVRLPIVVGIGALNLWMFFPNELVGR